MIISQEELHHTENCFIEINRYSKWLLKQTSVLLKPTTKTLTIKLTMTTMLIKITCLTKLPDFKLAPKSNHGINLIKFITMGTKKTLPDSHYVRFTLTSTSLSFYFNIKNDTNNQPKHNLVDFSRCPSTSSTDSYI